MDTLFDIRQVAQVRPSNTSFVTAFTGTNRTAVIKSIIVSNTTSSSSSFRICLDIDGTTFDETTALFWDVVIDANTTVVIETPITLININSTSLSSVTQGSIGVRSADADTLTFTIQAKIKQV